MTSVKYDNQNPVTISENTFSNRKNANLYVPIGSKTAFLYANYWKEFKQIIECDTSDVIITFADSKTKSLCMGKWDTNGDGELSETEASAASSPMATTETPLSITPRVSG